MGNPEGFSGTINLKTDEKITKVYENYCLTGKIHFHKPIHQALVQSFTETEWNCIKPVTVSNIRRNMYLFTFRHEKDLEHVMQNRPWTIMGGLLILSMCTSEQVPREINFSYSPFWVRVYGLPLDYLTDENGSRIGGFLGMYVCTDLETCYDQNVTWRKFLRVKVVLDVREGLKTGVWVKRYGLRDVWVEFKYEGLGVFCYKCGRIGSSFRTCRFPAGDGKYGPWLRPDFSLGVPVGVQGDRDQHCTSLVPVPKAEICDTMELEGISRRNLCGRLVLNFVDSIILVMNCGIIHSRVKSVGANEAAGNWRMLILMAAYIFHLIEKLVRVYRHSGFFKGTDGNGDGNGKGIGNTLQDILISMVFLVNLVFF